MSEVSVESVRELADAAYILFFNLFIFDGITQIAEAKNSLMQIVDTTENLSLDPEQMEEVAMPIMI